MNTVKRWLAGFLSFAMIFTSAAFTNIGSIAVFAANIDNRYNVTDDVSVTLYTDPNVEYNAQLDYCGIPSQVSAQRSGSGQPRNISATVDGKTFRVDNNNNAYIQLSGHDDRNNYSDIRIRESQNQITFKNVSYTVIAPTNVSVPYTENYKDAVAEEFANITVTSDNANVEDPENPEEYELTKETDYNVIVGDPDDDGKVSVNFEGTGDYTEYTFGATEATLVYSDAYALSSLDGKSIEATYTGEVIDVENLDQFASLKVAKTPKGKQDVVGTILQRGKDFTITTSNSRIGEATAEIVGIGSYSDWTFEPLPYDIVPAESQGWTVSVDEDAFTYGIGAINADRIAENTVVIFDGEKMKNGTNGSDPVNNGEWTALYTRKTSYSSTNNGDAGYQFQAVIRVKDSGEVKTIYDKVLTIKKRDLADLYNLSGTPNPSLTYNAKKQEPAALGNLTAYLDKEGEKGIQVPSNSYSIKKGTGENNVNACTTDDKDCATIEITATVDRTGFTNNFTGTAKVKFAINPYQITDNNIKLNGKITTVTYNGQPQNPALDIAAYFGTVTAGNEIPASDYAFEYTNLSAGLEYPVAVGTYNVKLVDSGDGNLKSVLGGKDVIFEDALTISAESLTEATATLKGAPVPAGTNLAAKDKDTYKNLYDYYVITTKGGHELALSEFTDDDLTVTYTSGSFDDYNTRCTVRVAANQNGNFKDAFSFTYTTASAKLADLYESNANNIVYDRTIGGARPNATALAPLVNTEDSSNILTASEFTVTDWTNWQSAGTAIATIRGASGSKYEGSTSYALYEIQPFNIARNGYSAKVTGIPAGIYCNGSKIENANVTIIYDVPRSNDDEEFTLTADDCDVVARTVTGGKLTQVQVIAKGNYTGTLNANVDVVSNVADFDKAVITGEIPAGLTDYTDAVIKRYVNVTIDGMVVDPAGFTLSNIASATTGKALGDLDSEISFKVSPSTAMGTSAVGSKTGKLPVVKRDIADLASNIDLREGDNSVTTATYKYDGAEKKPSVRIETNNTDAKATRHNPDRLEEGVDFAVSYENNINAGWATVTVSGLGNYKGSAVELFKINKHTVEAQDFVLVEPTDDKRQFKPGAPEDLSDSLTIKAATGKKFVFDKKDYTVKLVKNQNISSIDDEVKYLVTFNADSNNYVQNDYGFSVSYKLAKKTVTASNAEFTLGRNLFEYVKANDIDPENGAPYFTQKDANKHVIVVDGVTLKKDTDYSVTYEGTNKITEEIGKGDVAQNVVFTFKGNYTGVVKVPFTVVAEMVDLSNVFLKAPVPSVYTGVAIIPTIDDHNLVDIDKAAYNIVIKDAKGKVVGTYEFKNGVPEGFWALTETSVKAGLSGPIKAGTYTATIVATKAYGGVEGNSLTYKIDKKQLNKDEFKELAELVLFFEVPYAGANTKAPVILDNETKANDYWDEEYNDNLAAGDEFEVVDKSWDTEWDTSRRDYKKTHGDVKIQLKADSNYFYTGDPYDARFRWTPGELENLIKEISVTGQTYAGAGNSVNPGKDAIVLAEGSILNKDWMTIKSYTGDLDKAGKKAAFVNLTVSVPDSEKRIWQNNAVWSIPFDIAQLDIANVTITGIDESYDYTGQAIKPTVTLKLENGTVLKADEDYKVTYSDNTAVGTAKATIEGINNCTGKVEKAFEIKASDDVTKAAEAIAKLPGDKATEADRAALDEAQKLYDKLNDEQKKLADPEGKLEATKKAVETAEKAATEAAKKDAYAALDAAKDYKDVASVSKAMADLEAAIKSGDAAAIKATTKALNDAIAAAKKSGSEMGSAKTAATNALTAADTIGNSYPDANVKAVKSAKTALQNLLNNPNATVDQIKQATANLNKAINDAKNAGPKAGVTYKVGGQIYKATSNKAVTLIKAKNKKSVTVPASVKINGKKPSVTKIAQGSFRKKTKTVTVKTKKLTKKGVKNSLKGSKVKTIKVKVGKKKTNKKYVKKYKKFFTKKNAGKKVTVK